MTQTGSSKDRIHISFIPKSLSNTSVNPSLFVLHQNNITKNPYYYFRLKLVPLNADSMGIKMMNWKTAAMRYTGKNQQNSIWILTKRLPSFSIVLNQRNLFHWS